MRPKLRPKKSSAVDGSLVPSRDLQSKTDIMLVEPSNIFRAGLDNILSGSPYRIVSCNDSRNFDTVLPVAGRPPDLIILGTSIEGRNLIDVVQSLKSAYPSARIVCVWKGGELADLNGLLRVEVNAVLMADIGEDVLVKSLDLVMSGETVIPHHFLRPLVRGPIADGAVGQSCELADAAPELIDPLRGSLSVAELEILQLLINGDTNKAIGSKLSLSDAAVKVHVKGILRKIQVQNRTQAAIWAIHHLSSEALHLPD